MSAENIYVVADDREVAGGVIAALREFEGVNVEVRRLAVADFVVQGRILVERKTLADFAQSVIDARLFRQAAAIAAQSGRGVLMLEGSAADWSESKMSRESRQGALITVSVFYGLAVLRALDSVETARLLVYLGRQAQQIAGGALPRAGYRPRGKRARQLFLLQGLPGIGAERAASLLDRFGSVQAVVTASAAELVGIDGIGETTAAKMRWALG